MEPEGMPGRGGGGLGGGSTQEGRTGGGSWRGGAFSFTLHPMSAYLTPASCLCREV